MICHFSVFRYVVDYVDFLCLDGLREDAGLADRSVDRLSQLFALVELRSDLLQQNDSFAVAKSLQLATHSLSDLKVADLRVDCHHFDKFLTHAVGLLLDHNLRLVDCVVTSWVRCHRQTF